MTSADHQAKKRSPFAMVYPGPLIETARRHKLTKSDMFVYLAIAQHADRYGRAYPSLARIGEIVASNTRRTSRARSGSSKRPGSYPIRAGEGRMALGVVPNT
jgi:hypothetical protein